MRFFLPVIDIEESAFVSRVSAMNLNKSDYMRNKKTQLK